MIINECENISIPDSYTLDLNRYKIKDCTGCWTCWWTNPGRCTFPDLDAFFHKYVTADRAMYFARLSRGFVSGNMKTLFDRMIPLYLPYTTYKTGESMHVPRYDSYPEVEFYYEGEFESDDNREVFINYIQRVFYQFYTRLVKVEHISKFELNGKADK